MGFARQNRSAVRTPQTGIFALGDAAHIFLELSLLPGIGAAQLLSTVAKIHEPRTTVGGVNLVVGLRPELWRSVAPQATPPDAAGFDEPLRGAGGYAMPATQADLWLWFAGASYDVVFDSAMSALDVLRDAVRVERELDGWDYRHSRDLTGFEDGTENPTLQDAPEVAIADGEPGEGASIVLFQQWRHERSWRALTQEQQEAAMGRTKADSIELDEGEMPPDAHVARAKDVVDGQERKIFRRNLPYGNVLEHGTIFIGFSCEQSRLVRMLSRMAGAEDGVRDALTHYTTPLTGAYYVVPAVQDLRAFD